MAVTETQELDEFIGNDLHDLCEATVEAIVEGQGFGWLKPPARTTLEAYWHGVLLIPERSLFVARLEGTIVGTAQLIRPSSNNEAGAFAAELGTFFVAPWARGHGLARSLLRDVETRARRDGFTVLDVHVRADRQAAITLAEGSDFRRWATRERYARVDGKYLSGYFYTKDLDV
ncbi:MAG: GNAT family N-acetyltransferase [Sphingomonadales bacterium]